jgi:histone-lysine N-methyltransferase ASH1L
MALFALRDISPLEELSYDYNFSLFNPAEGQPCKCGSPQCRGVIGGKSQRVSVVCIIYFSFSNCTISSGNIMALLM